MKNLLANEIKNSEVAFKVKRYRKIVFYLLVLTMSND